MTVMVVEHRIGWPSLRWRICRQRVRAGPARSRLAIKNMMAGGGSRKRGLNRSLADAGLGELFRQLDYKSGWYGSRLVKADRWFPSSKLCSGCGVVKAKLHLSERTYECDGCGLTIDRDLNAAVNLARYAQRETDPSTGVVTGGADRKPHPR